MWITVNVVHTVGQLSYHQCIMFFMITMVNNAFIVYVNIICFDKVGKLKLKELIQVGHSPMHHTHYKLLKKKNNMLPMQIN